MKINIESFPAVIDLLRCPKTGGALKIGADGSRLISQTDTAISYPIVNGLPVIIDFSSSIVREGKMLKSLAERGRGNSRLKRLLNGRSLVTARNCSAFTAKLREKSKSSTVLVIGGGTIGDGAEALYVDDSIRLISLDIYLSQNLTLIADAHSIPLRDASVDGVWAQAVLEHVVDPHTVVEEIWRVLKSNGIVYAETPFMQMVHEGAYDFTRYSELGQRALFKKFEVFSTGAVAGPATVLRWAIRYFVAGIFRSRTIGTIVWVLTFWIRFLDSLISRPYASDGASCVYFFGKRAELKIETKLIPESYRGAQKT